MKTILIISRDPWLSFRQMTNPDGVTPDGRYRFVINDLQTEADFVVIKEKALREEHTFNVPRERTILLTGEPYSVLAYPRGFCSQFGTVLACQEEVKADAGTRVIHTPAILSWFVGADMQPGKGISFTMDYYDIERATPQKTKDISVITSTKAFTRGHIDRLRFVEKLQQRYGDRVDIFGHGFRDFGDKWDVLAPYKYHIVIENSSSRYYWTEKISDCYLAETFPLYHGCTNIDDYFPRDGYEPIDIRDFSKAAAVIDRTLASDLYESRREVLRECKRLVLDSYNIFNMIARACSEIEEEGGDSLSGQTTLRPASKFFSLHNLYLYTIDRNYCKLINRLHKPRR